MTHKSDNERAFCVVQFLELPFESIDDYVCVPHTWLMISEATNDNVVVAYPKDEDPFDTRDRVKRKERHNDEWRLCKAVVKYESNSYSDAEFWIARKNYYGSLVEGESKVTDTQPKLPVNKKLQRANQNHLLKSSDNFRKPLRSIKRPANSETKKEIDEKRSNLDASAPSSSAVVNDAKVEPRSPKRKQSVIIQDNQSMECSQAEKSFVTSNADESNEPRSKSPRIEQTEQALSSPVRDVDQSTEVINIDDEDHSQRVKKTDHNNSMSQTSSSSNITDVSMAAAKPSTVAEQSTQPNQYNHQEHNIPGRSSLSNFQPQIENFRCLANVDDRKRNLAIAAQNPSNSIDQTRHLPTSSEEQTPVVTQNKSQNDTQVLRTQLAQQRQMQSNQLDSQQQPQRTKLPTGIFIKPKDRKQVPSLQGVTKKTPPPNLTNVLESIRQALSTTHSPVIGSHLNVMGNACQADECMIDETLSPYYAVTSDSDTVTDHEEISDCEMSIDESPVETTNNVYGTTNDPGHGSADRLTAAQNSTARSHQMNPKVILEQQMLDNFADLFTQMCSTLRYTTDMYNTLRSLSLDTAETYKKLLGAVEQFNTAGNAASNVSPSSNLRPESPRSPEASHTKATASASSSNQDQRSNDVANKTPKKKHKKLYRFVLPPEYDAYDTRWTLKYRTKLPGLVELPSFLPQSGVYVSYGDLKYCQHVSKDCKSLARRLLPAVFSRNALSICSSMSEKAQISKNAGSNIRPDLDVHACSVLLNFVLEHGLQRGWNTDLKPILSTLQSKMEEIRFKYGVMVVC